MLRIKGTRTGDRAHASTATAATAASIRTSARVHRGGRGGAQPRRGRRASRSASPTASTSATPRSPTVMWQFQQAVARHPRRVRRARDAGGQRQRQLLQRDRGPGDPADADHRAWWVCSRTSRRTSRQWFKAEGDVIVLLGRTREELGGSEYLAVAPRPGARRAAVDRSRGREAAAARLPGGHRASGCCARRTTSRRAGSPWRSPSAASAGPAGSARASTLERGDPRRRAALRREPVAHHRLAAPAPSRRACATWRGATRSPLDACSARCAAGAW